MEMMMRDQLQKASAVLAVMDYTQMNSKADERFVKSLMPLLTSQPVVCLCWSINSMKRSQW